MRIVNDAVEHQSHADGKDHRGEELVVLVPVSAGITIDCKDTDGINLDNVKITIADNQKIFDPQSGEVVLDFKKLGQIVYEVIGAIKK